MNLLGLGAKALKFGSKALGPLGWATEAVGDVFGVIDYINRKTGILPDWAGDIVDTIDDFGMINSALEAGGLAPSESYGSQVREGAQAIGSLGMLMAPDIKNPWVRAGRLGLSMVRPFDTDPNSGQDNVPAGQQRGAVTPLDPTIQDAMANAIIEQALAEAEKQRNYAKWLQTQQQMADMYTKWHEAYPQEYESAMRKYYDAVR